MGERLPQFLRSTRPKPTTLNYHECSFVHGTSEAHSLWWPNGDFEGKLTVLLFIPGNPGLLDFYIPFLDTIHTKAIATQRPVAILAHSHLGHTPKFAANLSSTGLQSQIASAIEAFDAIKHSLPSDTRLVLAGHSVGSWICTQVFKARPGDVALTFLLFPTICGIASTPNGRRLSWLFRPPFPAIISKLSVATNLIPDWMLGYLFQDWPLAQRTVLRSLLRSPNAIKCALSMANDEMNTIQDLDVSLLQDQQHKFCLYFAEKDDWVGNQREVVLSAIDATPGAVKVVHGEKDIPHAFCINHGKQLASQCFEWLFELNLGQLVE